MKNMLPNVRENPFNNGISSNSVNLSTQATFPNHPTGVYSFQGANTSFPEGMSTFTDNAFEINSEW